MLPLLTATCIKAWDGRCSGGRQLLQIRHDVRAVRLGITQPWTFVLMLWQLGIFGGITAIADGRIR